MKSKLTRKALNVVIIAALAMPMVSCSKSSNSKKEKKVLETDRRRPKDNVFIENGGYSKKSKVNPFAADSSQMNEASKQAVAPVVVDDNKNEVKVEKVAMLSPSKKAEPRRNMWRVIASKISSFFAGNGSGKVVVASAGGMRRPMINDMVVSGRYIPNHTELMQVEQGSNTEGYAYDWYPIQENIYQPSGGEEVLDKIDIGADATITNANIKVNNYREVERSESEEVKYTAVKNIPIVDKKKVLESQLSDAIGNFLSISGSLCGINVEGDVGGNVVSIPEIEMSDLKAKKISKPNLANIPNIPKELILES